MKNLKKWTFLLLAVTFLGIVASCNNDDDSYYSNYYVQFGTLTKQDRTYYIQFDGEKDNYQVTDSTLLVYRQLNTKFPQRIIASYYYGDLRKDTSTPTVTLRDIVGVLTKDLATAPKDETESEKLGNDIIRASRAWISEGYLNVQFIVPTTANTLKAHLINAYDTGQTDTDGYGIIELRHNSNGISQNFWSGTSYVSFTWPVTENDKSYKLRFYYDKGMQRTIPIERYWECTAQQ